ncbi:nucleotidyl transferase AbiEii/AbiGii toxin family protein [Thermosinus carboxydivorans]|nr:nucleotidyl transferase AbiEii/AbiGii toxin family protein [Thermosinus carboxydivorans]
MYWQVLDAARRDLLERIAVSLPLPGSYLAGGTALALLLGHRMSEDFDWFCPSDFDPGQLSERLRAFGIVEVAETAQGTFHGWFD